MSGHQIGVEFRGGTVARRFVSLPLECGEALLVERTGDEVRVECTSLTFRLTDAERATVAVAIEGRPAAPPWKAADTALLLDEVLEILMVRLDERLTLEVADDRARNLVGSLLGQYELRRLPPLID